MLFFVLSDTFRERPLPEPVRSESRPHDYASALLASALVLSVWSATRLFIGRSQGLGFDLGLAVACLALGLGTVFHCVRSLTAVRSRQRRARAEQKHGS